MGITEKVALELCLDLSLVIFFFFGNETISMTSGWGLGIRKVITEMFLRQIELETGAM